MEDRNTVRVRPPRGNGSGLKNAAYTQAVTASSATAVAVSANVALPVGSGAWVSFISTQACHIRFGQNTGKPEPVGAATTSDKLIPANTEFQFWCHSVFETHFSVIRASADGVLHWNVAE